MYVSSPSNNASIVNGVLSCGTYFTVVFPSSSVSGTDSMISSFTLMITGLFESAVPSSSVSVTVISNSLPTSTSVISSIVVIVLILSTINDVSFSDGFIRYVSSNCFPRYLTCTLIFPAVIVSFSIV